jgi:hypothetical protein
MFFDHALELPVGGSGSTFSIDHTTVCRVNDLVCSRLGVLGGGPKGQAAKIFAFF